VSAASRLEALDPLLPVSKAFLFDLDGTLLLSDRTLGGYEILPGAIEVLTTLHDHGVPFAVLTNGSAYPPAVQAAKLRKLGLPVSDEQMFTPSSVAADVMPRRGVKRALVLGARGVAHALEAAGIEIVFADEARPSEVDAVYVGWHPDCCMKDIEAACNAIWGGAIRRVTKAPMTLIGKPSLHALYFAARKLGVSSRELAVIGDDPKVEIMMARRGRAAAYAVTTGVTTEVEWYQQSGMRRPHRVLSQLRDLLSYPSLVALCEQSRCANGS
jgi:4-nitrophenyl phosphatase